MTDVVNLYGGKTNLSKLVDGGPESKASPFRPESTMARSSAGRLTLSPKRRGSARRPWSARRRGRGSCHNRRP
jgi:hypothetical protein